MPAYRLLILDEEGEVLIFEHFKAGNDKHASEHIRSWGGGRIQAGTLVRLAQSRCA